MPRPPAGPRPPLPSDAPFVPARDRPHWAARTENTKNRLMGRFLQRLGWDVRLQPFIGYGAPGRIRVLAKVLYASPSAPADYHDQPVHDMRTMAVRGWRNFASQVAPFARVRVTIAGDEFLVHADRSGIIDTELLVDLPAGRHEAVLSTHPGNAVTAEVLVFSPDERIGVVSDIDDTVMITWLPRPLLAFWNAFVIHQSSRRVVRGMPALYQEILREHPAAPVVYLSTGAWNVFPVLRRFLFKNGYPDGPMLLTDWGPTNTGFFRSGREHKVRALARLAEAFPQVRWILIGDDGQHDPDTYRAFEAHHPEHVEAIAIRQLTEPEQVLAHGSRRPLAEAPSRLPGDSRRTVRAPDGHGLARALRRLGVLS